MTKGLLYLEFSQDPTADEQGLKVGDRIEAVNGRSVSEVIEFIEVLDSTLGEGKIHLLILRNKNKFHFELTQRS